MEKLAWLSAKGVRTFDGQTYHWSAHGSRNQGFMAVRLRQDGPDSRCYAHVMVRGDALYDFPFAKNVPEMLPDLVVRARTAGWRPDAGRKAFRLDVDDGPMGAPCGPLERLGYTLERLRDRAC